MDYNFQTGDIILKDSNQTGAKIVKYLMRSPTIWHDIYRMITHTITPSPYYHVQLGYDEIMRTVGEQQAKVQIATWNPNSTQIVFRYKYLTPGMKVCLQNKIEVEKGQGYDVLNIIGKTLTWLTGIKLFAKYFHFPKCRICDARVTNWIRVCTDEDFGGISDNCMTTKLLYLYLINNDNWEVVYKNG